jgi:hypothetical protein
MTDASKVTLLKKGTWQRAGQRGRVFIIRQDWDYYFDEYSAGEPDLDSEGFAYYAVYGLGDALDETTSRSPTCTTEAEAMDRAVALAGPIQWDLPVERLASG